MSKQVWWLGLVGISVLLAACKTAPVARQPVAATPTPATVVLPPAPLFTPSKWEVLPEWSTLDLTPSWAALLQSCRVLKAKPQWQAVCSGTELVDKNDSDAQRKFYEDKLAPFQVFNPDGSENGVITGYYEPLLKGDRVRTSRARYPLYAAPDDLITVDLASLYPELKNLRLRGRMVGNKIVPYPTRKEIESAAANGKVNGNGNGNGFNSKPIAWAEDPVDLFFLQIQGSGRIELPDGSHMRVGYADQNGHPYQSVGKLLVERGELKLEQASMQGIKDWGMKNPDKLPELLASNPSFVFFRELPNDLPGPLGSLGVPLTGERSIAVDPRFLPLGAPVFLATTQPNSPLPLNRLVMAQDTGGAIRGGVRADFFWGFGNAAGELAGRMKQRGRMWVLLPKDYPMTSVRR